MNQNWNNIIAYGYLLGTLLTVCLPIQPIRAESYRWKWSTGRIWKLEAHDTYLKFSESLYCDNIGYDTFPQNSRWYFQNPSMGGTWLGWWWISVENGNVTITKFFQSSLFEAQLTGSSITMEMQCPMPESVAGADSYSWYNNVLTVTAAKSTKIVIDFTPPIPENPYLNERVLPVYFSVLSLGMTILPILFMCYAIPRRQVSGANCIVLAFVSFIGFCLLMATREM